MRRPHHSIFLLPYLLGLASLLAGCSLMQEDRSACPTCDNPLRVVLKYDYNIRKSNWFGDHVQQATVYVADAATGQIVSSLTARNTPADKPLRSTSFAFNFYDLPEGDYRIFALANTPAAEPADLNPAPAELLPGDNLADLAFTLDATDVSSELDTVWTTLDAHTLHFSPWEAKSDTLDLMRLTNNLNIVLAQTQNPADNFAYNYTVRVVDHNASLDHDAFPLEGQAPVVYSPYASWTMETVEEEPPLYTESAPSRAAGDVVSRTAHFDLSLNRLIAHDDSRDNARLQIINNADGKVIVDIDLIHYLTLFRTSSELSYLPQEYLDREFDYRLTFYLVGSEWKRMDIYVAVLGWSLRVYNEAL